MNEQYVWIKRWHLQGYYLEDGRMRTRCQLLVWPPLTTAQGPDAPGPICGNCRKTMKEPNENLTT